MPMRVFMFRAYSECLKAIVGKARVYKAPTFYGSVINCNLDDLIQKRIFYFGVWEPAISEFTKQLLREGDTYIDVGANIGYDSMLAAHCVGKSGHVVAIEALPMIYALLNDNIKQNNIRNIRTVNVAASDFTGEISLYFGGNHNTGTTTAIKGRVSGEECKVVALPIVDVLSDDEMSQARLIKIDIEGGELPVLNNIIDNIDKFPNDLNIIVEASAHEDKIGWEKLSVRYIDRGFNLYEVENIYHISWYLKHQRRHRLRTLEVIPDHQVDVLFTRRKITDLETLRCATC